MKKQNYLFLLLLSLAVHTQAHAAQMNVEVKEKEEKQLSVQEQVAATKMFDIVQSKTTSDIQQHELQTLLQRYPQIVNEKNDHGLTRYRGCTALMIAAWNGNAEIVQMLVDAGAQLNVQNNYGRTALFLAAHNGKVEIVKLLIAAGAEIAEKEDAQTALMIVAYNGNAEIIKLLIAAGAQLDVKDSKGRTALMHAVDQGRAEVVQLLIDAGAQINVKNNESDTALTLAVKNYVPAKVIQSLIAAGAKLDEQDDHGYTPLMRAAYNGNAEAVQLLIAADADKSIRNRKNQTALDLANLREWGAGNRGAKNDWGMHYQAAVKAGEEERRKAVQAKVEQHMIPDLAKIVTSYNP